MTKASRRLGRGLEALLGPSAPDRQGNRSVVQLPLATIRPNPYQPRHHLDRSALNDLKQSLGESGLLQPIVVRPAGDHGYELIAGARRRQAAEELGWKRIAAVVRQVDDRTLLALSLVENLQRDALSPIDEALGYRRVIEDFGASQTDVAQLVGRDRSTVTNALRLLKLPTGVQEMVHNGRLSTGHARALLQLQERGRISLLAQRAAKDQLSVRELEALTRGGRAPRRRPRAAARNGPQDPHARRVEDALRRRLGTDVFVATRAKGSGRVTINFYSNDDLARILELLLGEPFDG
jgi:ParB family chromosome partitioning protein